LARAAYRHAQSAKDVLLAVASLGHNLPRLNESINRLECRYGRHRLWGYPPVVGFALSNYCNQRCRFCSLDLKHVTRRVVLPAEIFEHMTWFRYVREIWLSGAAGDSLVHPDFARIARTVRRLAPKSRLMVCTNGLGLCGENLEATDCLDYINISANAASEPTYGVLIKGGSFRRLLANLEALSDRKKASLAVHLSMVLARSAVSDVAPMIDLAARLKFDAVEIYQYFPIPPVDGALPLSESLNDDPNAWDAVRQLAGYAREKGVGYIVAGEQLAPCRSFNTVVKYPGAGGCSSPWSNGHISIGPDGEMAFSICCSGVSMNLAVEDLAFADFKRIWNCQRMQDIRRTVNACDDRQNNMCWLCRRLQRADYGSKRELRELAGRKRPSIGFTASDDPIAFPKEKVA
jgi:MoaA/NifB/PqqE/SkfB family radical SAM enzyme